ncbi:MAG: exodeoxyribonuclease VII small subunit [Thermomicrobiales bacterium]
MRAQGDDSQNFEDLLRQFDDAVNSLESDELSLEAALSRYEAAVQLADRCTRILQDAELRVREIDKSLERMESDPEA